MLLSVLRSLAPLRKGQQKVGRRIISKAKRRDDVINTVSTLAYNEVERAGNLLGRTPLDEDCTVAFPSIVFGQQLVADSGRGIIVGHFEHVGHLRCDRSRWHRGAKCHYRRMRAATIARRIPDGRPGFDDVQLDAGGGRSTARFAPVHRQRKIPAW